MELPARVALVWLKELYRDHFVAFYLVNSLISVARYVEPIVRRHELCLGEYVTSVSCLMTNEPIYPYNGTRIVHSIRTRF